MSTQQVELLDTRSPESPPDCLSTQMHVALERGEFFLIYQPMVRLSDKRFIGAEAFLRWAHPTRGTLLPGQFIALAEANGLIATLTAFLMEQACLLARGWRHHDTSDPRRFVSVNVSASNIYDPSFLPLVESMLTDTGLPAHALQLEFTANANLGASKAAAIRLQELSGLGINLAIDDFNAESSSFDDLHNLPVNVVKLVSEFIKHPGSDIPGRLGGEEITHAMVSLAHTVEHAHALGLTVTAEQVETPRQAARLHTLGCDAAQGWHFAKALPADFFSE